MSGAPVIAGFVPDRFNAIQRQQAGFGGSEELYKDVRRPTRGIQLKNETFATIRIFKGSGEMIPLVNAGSRDEAPSYGDYRASNVYSNFFIQQVDDKREEKQQIVQTFGEAYIFLYGQQPRILNISGVLLNTFDFNWEAEWWWNYENYLRGSKCVENDARVFLTVDDTLVSGYIIAAGATKQAQERNWIPFQFQLFVTGYSTFSRLGDSSADQEGIDPVNQSDEAARRLYTAPGITQYFDGSVAKITNLPVTAGKINAYGETLTDQLLKNMSVAQSRIDTVLKYWSKVSNTVANLDQTVDTIFGAQVRIPAGWSGAIEGDDYTKYRVVKLDQGEPVRFTTFSDNEDEYVRGYTPSATALDSRIRDWSLAQVNNDIMLRPSLMVAKAKAEWAKYGIYPPDEGLVRFVADLKKSKLGAKIVGKAEKVVRTGLGVAQDVAAVGNQVAGVAVMASAGLGVAQAGVRFAQSVPALAEVAKATTTQLAQQVGNTVGAAANDILGRSGSSAPQG